MSFIQTTKYSLSIQKLILKGGRNTFIVQVFRFATDKMRRIHADPECTTRVCMYCSQSGLYKNGGLKILMLKHRKQGVKAGRVV